MITTPPQFGTLVDELTRSAWILAAIGALFDSGLADLLREPHTVDELASRTPGLSRERIARCLDVLATRGVVSADGDRYRLAPGVVPYVMPSMGTSLRGDCRSSLMQPLAYLDAATAATPSPGWCHTDRAILQAQGDASSGFAPAFTCFIAPNLGDLVARLARPGSRFLDVGVGVGALSIAMCRELPQLHAVGLDASDTPLAIARENIARAGMTDRIELRQLAVQDLREEAAYDLAWLPTCFIPAAHVPAAIARVRAALRPGGWILVPSIKAGLDDEPLAVCSMINEVWGGPVVTAPDGEAMLRAAGFEAPRALPGPNWTALVTAQR